MFKSKKINAPNCIGNILKTARQQTGLSLKMVAKHISIDKKYLEAIEKDDWQKLPGEVYAKNFLKKYCEFLKINQNELNIDWEKISCFKHKNHKESFTKKTRIFDFLNLPKTLRITLIAIITLIIVIYLIWQINQIIRAPEITIFSPDSDITISTNTLVITGQTKSEVKLKINNEVMVLDENYNFEQILNLQPGLNTITIEGKKKYSKTQIIERKIIVDKLD